jgi:UDP-hydrolysing UDP-N-acetyl-D-glucosamine 2-epimerase
MMNNSTKSGQKKICVITTTRADYGLLYWPMKLLKDESDFILQIVASGSHLSPEHSNTYLQIEKDGFEISEKVEMLVSSDTTLGATKSFGLAVIGFGEAYTRLNPDCIMILGDRYEALAAATAALMAGIPIAHIAGGDSTEGAFDEGIRHSITKMSHLHFVTNEQAAGRVRQLGENPRHVYVTGSPGLDYIRRFKGLSRDELAKQLGLNFKKRNLLVTYHPETLTNSSSADFDQVLKALDSLGQDLGIFFTRPNQDPAGRALSRQIDEFIASHANGAVFTSLGQDSYLSMIREVDAVVGNSSSGLYEVPSFKRPTVNIGDRQKGRLFAKSVINCRANQTEVATAINAAFDLNCSDATNPYGDGHASEKIVEVLREVDDFRKLLKKHFFNLSMQPSEVCS